MSYRVHSVRPVYRGLPWLLLTLGFCFAAQRVASTNALQLLVAALSVAGFGVLFATKPSLVPSCIIASVAAGGLEIQVGGSTPKVFFASLLLTAYVLSAVIRAALRRETSSASADFLALRLPGREYGIAACAALYLILLLPSLSQMLVPQRSIYLIAMRVLIVVGVIALLRERRILGSSYDVLLAVSVVGSIIAATYCVNAIRQYGAGNIGELALGLASKDNTVQVGLLGTTNTIASFLCFTLPITIGFALLPDLRVRMRTFAILGILVQGFGLLGTASRGGLFALVGGVSLVAVLGNRSLRHMPRLLRFVGLAALVAGVAYFAMGEAIRDRMTDSMTWNMIGYYAIRRSQLWLSSWRAFTGSPVFGIGIGNVGFFDRDYGTGDGSETHNLFLQTLAEEGFIAAIILTTLLWKLLSRSIGATRKSGSTGLWIATALAAALLDSLIEPTFWAPPFAALFWTVAVFVYRSSSLYSNATEAPFGVLVPRRFETSA